MDASSAARTRSTKSAKKKPSAKKPRGSLRWLLQSLALLLAIAGFLAGLIALGHWGLEQIRGRERYLVALAEIECEPPPGLDRQEFLDEVQYYASPVPERVSVLDDDMPARLRTAFGRHPWVEKVDDIVLTPPRRIQVRLTYRRPVLAVRWEGTLRAVDGAGILLPIKTPTRGLPIYDGAPRKPRGEGNRWGDPDLELQARKLQPPRKN